MEKILYGKNGQPVAYVTAEDSGIIYLWEGEPVAYVYEEAHVYGINGQHLGWFKDDVLFDQEGERVGFTSGTCPATIAKSPPKGKKAQVHELKPRWKAPPPPNFRVRVANRDLKDFLSHGAVTGRHKGKAKGPAHD